MKAFIFYFSIFFLSFFAEAKQNCISTEFKTSNNNLTALPKDGTPFVQLNSRPLPGNVDRNTVVNQGDYVAYSKSYACFDSSILKVGTNNFSMKFAWDKNVENVIGGAKFTLNEGTKSERLLCEIQLSGNQKYTCDISVDLELKDIDSKTAKEIEEIRQEIRRLKASIEHQSILQDLQDQLSHLDSLPFDRLTTEDLIGVDLSLKELALEIEASKSELDKLRDQAAQEIEKQSNYLDKIQEYANEYFRKNNDDISSYLPNVKMPEISVSTDGMGTPTDQNGFILTSEIINEFISIIKIYKDKFKYAAVTQDTKMYYALVVGWYKTINQIESQLKSNDLQFDAQSVILLRQEISNGKSLIDDFFDSRKFVKNGPIPEDVRELVAGPIKDVFGAGRSETLTLILNEWKGAPSEIQQMLIASIRNIGVMAQTFKSVGINCTDCANLKDGNGKTPKEKLSEILDQTIEVAKIAGKVSIALSPYQKFIDFCEFTVGKEFCNPVGRNLTAEERAFSAVAIIIGSSLFWKEMAELKGFLGSTKVGGFASRIYESAAKLVTENTPQSMKHLLNTFKSFFKKGVSAKVDESWARFTGILQDASKGKGNFGVGQATKDEAMEIGKAWVGDGYRAASDGTTLISKDSLRQFRPPSVKPNIGKVQANLEWRNSSINSEIFSKEWQGNAHLDILD